MWQNQIKLTKSFSSFQCSNNHHELLIHPTGRGVDIRDTVKMAHRAGIFPDLVSVTVNTVLQSFCPNNLCTVGLNMVQYMNVKWNLTRLKFKQPVLHSIYHQYIQEKTVNCWDQGTQRNFDNRTGNNEWMTYTQKKQAATSHFSCLHPSIQPTNVTQPI